MRKALKRYELKLPLWLIPMLYVGVTIVCGFVLPRLEHEYLAACSRSGVDDRAPHAAGAVAGFNLNNSWLGTRTDNL
jgi:hypothetical protein